MENRVIKDAENTMNKFQELNKRVFYVTNNSTKTRDELLAKCHKLGFEAKQVYKHEVWVSGNNINSFICFQDDIISTAYLAAEYLKSLGFSKKVYVIGSGGITKELDTYGIKHTGNGVITANFVSYNFENKTIN